MARVHTLYPVETGSNSKLEVCASLNLMDLPIEMVLKIFSYLSFDQIAKLRPVSRKFNDICMDLLNKGFFKLESFHSKCIKFVKSKLPRRESERKHHPLARHTDILMAVETRLSMLSMTFTKYIEAKECCFIPGRVLDEAFKVLNIVMDSASRYTPKGDFLTLPRPYDFLQEYRDISSMAMEYFDEKMVPIMKERMKSNFPETLSKRVKKSFMFRSKPLSEIHGGDLYAQVWSKHLSKNENFNSITRRLITQTPAPTHTVVSNPAEAMKLLKLVGQCASASPATSEPAASPSEGSGNSVSGRGDNVITIPDLTFIKMVNSIRNKSSRTRKYAWLLHRELKNVVKKMKTQNVSLKRKLDHQASVIKMLRRELKETRSTVSAMNKDLDQMKMIQASTKDHSVNRLSCSNLSIAVTSSLSIPEEDNAPNGRLPGTTIKRKVEIEDEKPSKKHFGCL